MSEQACDYDSDKHLPYGATWRSQSPRTKRRTYTSASVLLVDHDCGHSSSPTAPDWLLSIVETDDWNTDSPGRLMAFVTASNIPTELFTRTSVIRDQAQLRKRFNKLVRQWTDETEVSSFSHDICMHPAYQRIIGMGEQVIPLILEEADRGNGHWHWALRAITGENPAQHADSLLEAAAAWVEWGKEQYANL